jgi:two-component system sensor histidine kinase DesK
MNLLTPFLSAEERARLTDPVTPREIRTRRMIGLIWATIWSLPIINQANDVVRATDAPWLALVLFAVYFGLYLNVIMRAFIRGTPEPPLLVQVRLWIFAALGVMLSIVYSTGVAGSSLILLLYVAVAGVATYPPPISYYWLIGVGLIIGGVGFLQGDPRDHIASIILNTAFAAALVTVVRNMVRLIRELERTRNELAHSAVEQERLRFARDLHDLLGHTLSLIVVKAEVARRLADRDPAATAREAAEIEQIGRQALAEVREAVTGYRARAFADELANARSALADAGIEVTVRKVADGLPAAVDQAFAWAVREAATNVIRHSGARTCWILLERGSSETGATWALTVRDDGRGRMAGALDGNGLRGLRERMAALGGTLTTSDAGGFAVRASAQMPAPAPASGRTPAPLAATVEETK